MSITTDFWTIAPTSSNGELESEFPNGAPGTITWEPIQNYPNESAAFSVNILTTFLTPSSGPTLVLNGTLPAGWTFNGTTLAYNGSGVGGPNSISFTASQGGVSVTSNSFSVQGIGTQSTGTAIAAHFGHYVALDQNASLSENIAHINDDLAGTKNLIGVVLFDFWANAEFGTTISSPAAAGIYQAGTQGDASTARGIYAIQLLLAACKAATSSSAPNGLMLHWGVEAKAFGTWSANGGSYGAMPQYFDVTRDSTGSAPLYLEASQTQAQEPGSLLCCPKNYDSVITNRWDQMMKAYGAAFNGDPNFEMVHNADETSNGLYGSDAQYDAQIQQMCGVNPTGGATLALNWGNSMATYFPNKGRRFTTNFMGGTTNTTNQFQTLFNNSIQYAVAMGGPDSSTNLSTPNDLQVFNGNLGGTSYVNNLPFLAETQSVRGYDTSTNTPTIATLYAFYMTSAGSLANGGQCMPNYWVWHPYDGVPYTLAQILTLIEGNNPLNTTAPSSYKTTGGGGGTGTFKYFVGPTGSDTNSGTSATSPWSLGSLLNPAAFTLTSQQAANQAKLASNSVGFNPGTYACVNFLPGGVYWNNSNAFSTPAFLVPGGSAGAPTIFQSTTARSAILDAGATASTNPQGQPLLGNIGSGCQYITVDGFEIKNIYNRGISLGVTTGAFGTQPTQLALGLVVQNCYVHAMTNNIAAANATAITIYSANGAIVQNNYITDLSDTQGRADAIEFWTSINSIAQYNTVIATGQGMYAGIVNKNQWNWNNIIRYNYVDLTLAAPLSEGAIVMDSNGTSATIDQCYNNIIISDYPIGSYLIATGNFPASVNQQAWFGNTIVGVPLPGGGTGFTTVGFFRLGATGTIQWYNNIVKRSVTGYRGDVCVSASALSLANYNCYPASPELCLVANGTQNSPSSTSTSLAAWDAALPSTTAGKDQQSVLTNTPGFSNNGSLAQLYQIAPGTACSGTGHVGGISTGAAIDMGAWGGNDLNTGKPIAQLGCNFTP